MTESSYTLAFQRLFFMRSGGFRNVFALFARHLFIEVEIRRCSFDGLLCGGFAGRVAHHRTEGCSTTQIVTPMAFVTRLSAR